MLATFQLRFLVSSGAAHASGRTGNQLLIRQEGNALKLTSLKEQRLRK